nr:hypothetical protein [Micromonospora sp. DSM 115978]
MSDFFNAEVPPGDYIYLVAFAVANAVLRGPVAWLIRRSRGEAAAATYGEWAGGAVFVAFCLWLTLAWGLAWGGLAFAGGFVAVAVLRSRRRREARALEPVPDDKQ